MFRRATQFASKRFNSHGHGHKRVSPFINDPAFKPDAQAGEKFRKAYEQKVKHSGPVANTWKKITYFVAFPAVVLAAIPIYQVEMKHAEHREHLRHVPDEEWPTQYAYHNIRNKKFFWLDGDKTLFWNPDVNRHIES